jgi:hypothetical protein
MKATKDQVQANSETVLRKIHANFCILTWTEL